MSEVEATEVEQATIIKKDRSPSFPFITLTKAVERTRELFLAARRHEMRLPEAAKAMGYGAKSSGAIQTLAALIAYGLVEDSGAKESRKFRVSDLGFKILEDKRPGAREGALAEAALLPKMMTEYAVTWSEGRPADNIAISTLRFDDGFTEDGAKAFLKVYDDAIAYAKVGASDKESDTLSLRGGLAEPPRSLIDIGDLVRVETGGQVIFEKVSVRAIREYDGQMYVYMEGSESGVPMDDVTLLEKKPAATFIPPKLPLTPQAEAENVPGSGVEMDRFTVDEGVVKITFPSGMTSDSVEELEQFFNLFIKKAKRRAGAIQNPT